MSRCIWFLVGYLITTLPKFTAQATCERIWNRLALVSGKSTGIIIVHCTTLDCLQVFLYTTGIMYFSVNGSWGPWSQWSICSRTCNIGQRRRIRICDSPAPSNGGLHCNYSGDSAVDVVNCKMDDCPPHSWNNWSQWSACSVTCSNGTSARNRTCTVFAMCSGNNTEIIDCRLRSCPGLFWIPLSLILIFSFHSTLLLKISTMWLRSPICV